MIRATSYEGKYTHLWQKYRPVILKLMIDAVEEPKSYQFQKHEFTDLNNQKPTGYSFKMEVARNERQNKVSSSVATDLLSILQSSARSHELTTENKYLFKMDAKFKLEVSVIEQ